MASNNLGSGFVSDLESGFLASGFTTIDGTSMPDETLLSNQGMMSDTYRRTLPTGKIEIVKRIKSKFKDNNTYKQLFIQEYNTLDGLQDPNIVSTYQHGKDQHGLWYSMEYVDGDTLAQIIKNNGITKLPQKIDILRQILNGLQYVHDKGLVHRDLKPDNIMVGNRNNNVKIIDFGLAISDAFPDNLKVAGTPKYMSPEQRSNAKNADKLSDIYAFGIIMKEFLGEESSKIFQYRNIIEKCTKEDKSERYQNCSEILKDLADKNKIISASMKKLIMEIVDDGIVTEAEKARLDAEIDANNYDKDLVYKELEYQLEKVCDKLKRRKKLTILLVIVAVSLIGIAAFAVFSSKGNDNNSNKTAISDTTHSASTLPSDSTTIAQPIDKKPEQPIVNEPESPVIDVPKTPVVDVPTTPADKKPNLDYGTFDGTVINGEPTGQGTLKYSEEHLFNRYDDKQRKAMPGDKVFGDFDENGNLIQGKITHPDGSTEFIMIGGR